MSAKAAKEPAPPPVPALVVNQWLDDWEAVKFDEKEWRRKPQPIFYLFNLSASVLQRLSGVYRRKADKPRAQDLAIQRRLNVERAQEISRFVIGGFPWSAVNVRQRESGRFRNLRMPGWLPTAIIANILPAGSVRDDAKISKSDLISVTRNDGETATITLPSGVKDDNWHPAVRPLEIIDGQHRLLAFDYIEELHGNLRLPVVAFYNLDRAWQAYLFYTINIKPKRINQSLAFDLYPLLRTQDWLEEFEGPSVYRETRAQEITEALWRHPDSPWCGRINMLGEPKSSTITQAAFIRSLLATYVKRFESPKIGGLFGAELASTREPLPWARMQQIGFLIAVWQRVESAARECTEPWAKDLRRLAEETEDYTIAGEPAFESPYSLLSSDQGVRGVLYATNDLIYLRCDDLGLRKWVPDEIPSGSDDERISAIIPSLPSKAASYVMQLATELMRFEWRTSRTPGLPEEARLRQAAYRGSGGYKELRRQLLFALEKSKNKTVAQPAAEALDSLGYRN